MLTADDARTALRAEAAASVGQDRALAAQVNEVSAWAGQLADEAVDDLDSDDICSDPYEEGCTASLDDGEGWNGACGNCADRQYAEEEDEWELDDTDAPAADQEIPR